MDNDNKEDEKVIIPPPEVKKQAEDTVTLPKSEFDAVLKRIEGIEKKNEMLEKVADRGRLARWKTENQDFKTKDVRVSSLDGKIINGWKTVKDEVGKNPNTGLWFEKQIIEVHFTDSTKKEMDYADFQRRIIKVNGHVIRTNKFNDADGSHEIFTVDIDGKEIDIDIRFVN